jgi:replicative DNA helicase
MTDIVKPMSLETEQHLIGAVMRGGRKTFEKVKDFIDSEMFWSVSHRSVWDGIKKIYDNGMQLDVVIIGDEMERMQAMGEIEQEWGNGVWSGRSYLGNLRSEGDPRNVETYAEQVQDYHIKRHLLDYSSKIAYWSANGRRGKDIMQDVEAELSKITLFTAQDEYTNTITEGASRAYDWTDRAAKGEIVGVPTGFIDLDKIIGTLIAGNVYIVAGRPGTGKTAFCLSIARHVAKRVKNNKVGIFSLEMSLEQVSQRLIAQEAEIDLQGIIQGTLKDGDWSKFTHGVEMVASWNIVVNDLSSINIAQIRNTARKMKANGGLDLLIVDYVQLATGTGAKKNEKRYEEVGEVSRGLKHLARELNVPILAAAQLSRAVEQRQSKRPILSDLRESGDLEQDAYGVMFIYNADDETKVNVTNIEIAKHRNGPVGSCELIFRAPMARFDNAQTRTFRPNDER